MDFVESSIGYDQLGLFLTAPSHFSMRLFPSGSCTFGTSDISDRYPPLADIPLQEMPRNFLKYRDLSGEGEYEKAVWACCMRKQIPEELEVLRVLARSQVKSR